jgi:hypothetical protein
MKLDYAKSVFCGIVDSKSKETNTKIVKKKDHIIYELNSALKVLDKQNSNPAGYTDRMKNRLLRDIKSLQTELEVEIDRQGQFLARLANSKWYNEGEKSCKYFLNIINYRQGKKIQNRLVDGDKVATKQEEMLTLVRDFYQRLYHQPECQVDPTHEHDAMNEYFRNSRQLTEQSKSFMDTPLTIEELKAALKSCKNSTPGIDGIAYDFYKEFWDLWGNLILEAWEFSLLKGYLSPSNKLSIITLLPKDGKDPEHIGNLRPISLTNCDIKIVTKALAIKLAKVSAEIIHENQTAYVPGRSVMDNLRTIKALADGKLDGDIDKVIVSLDAKKAFDSVSHKFIEESLKRYGFGHQFIHTFKVLYTDLKARVLVNGWQTELIDIMNGVKQGDALSCIIFIIVVDPLIRNINCSDAIRPIADKENPTNAFAYADDINACAKADLESVNMIFKEYSLLTRLSGLSLNADKTELLRCKMVANKSRIYRPGKSGIISLDKALGRGTRVTNPTGPEQRQNETLYQVIYKGANYMLTEKQKIKICGITIASDESISYLENVTRKIEKLKEQLNKWRARGLCMLGKLLIIKTFGISHLIYVAQCCTIKEEDVKQINNVILNFLWTKGQSAKRVERIKREIIYKPTSLGGFGVIEFGYLNKPIKLKQAYRSSKVQHPIKKLQNLPRIEPFLAAYTSDEDISSEVKIIATEVAYDLIKNKNANLQWLPGIHVTKLHEYFGVQGMPAHYAKLLSKDNYHTISEIYNLKTCPRLGNKAKLAIKWVEKIMWPITEDMHGLIQDWIVSKENFGIYSDNYSIDFSSPQSSKGIRNGWMAITMSTDQPINLQKKYPSIPESDKEKIAIQTIAKIRSVRLKNNILRILNGDVFSKERMFRFGMITEDKCDRCGQIETRDHLLFNCEGTKKMWTFFASIYKKALGRPFLITERNILGCGDNYNSLATTTIISELNKVNVLYRNRFANEEELLAFIRPLIHRED